MFSMIGLTLLVFVGLLALMGLTNPWVGLIVGLCLAGLVLSVVAYFVLNKRYVDATIKRRKGCS